MNKKIILIVDDEPANINIVASNLSHLYEIRVATEGRVALEMIEDKKPDLILLDIVMPNMDGYEVATKLKSSANTSNIPFIFLTAKNDSKSISEGFRYGAVDYISKPFTKEELLARVANHLKLHELQNNLSKAVQDVSRANFELKKNRSFLESILNNSFHAIISTDSNGLITLFNHAAQNLLGYEAQEVIGIHTPEIYHDKSEVIQKALEFSKELKQAVTVGFETFVIKSLLGVENRDEWIFIRKDGEKISVNLSVTVQKDDKGNIEGYIGIAEDITENLKSKRVMEEQQIKLQESEEKLSKLFNHQRNIIVISDGKEIKMANKAMCTFFGIEKVEEFTRFYRDISDKFMDVNSYFSLSKVQNGGNWIEVLEPLLGDKRVVAMHDVDNIPHAFSVSISKFDESQYIISLTDISATMLEKIELSNKVTKDALTGVLNREFLNQNAKLIIDKFTQKNDLGVTMLDIDFFKKVNDTYGHNVGDIVLKELASAIGKFMRREDFLIRWGGEEFIILMETDSIKSLKKAIEHLRQAIENTKFTTVDKLTCSFGITLYTDNEDIIKTIERADKALYVAKTNGRNRVESAEVLDDEK